MKKVICFSRVSTQAQDLTVQRLEVEKAILKDGFKKSEILYVEAKESAIKLSELERTSLNELKEALNGNPQIKDVYFFAIDRLARKVSIVLSIVEQMIEIGVNLHFLNPYPMQTLRDGKEDAMGKMFLTFLSIGAEMEMKMKSERFQATKNEMKVQGKIVSGVTLYGYYRDDNGFAQVKEDEAEIIRKIFNEYDNGCSANQVAKKMILNGDGWSDVSTLKAAAKKITLILKNKAYSGRAAITKAKTESAVKYPVIVDAELQDRCIKKLSDTAKEKDTTTVYYAKGLAKWNNNGEIHPMAISKATYCYEYRLQKAMGHETFTCSLNVIESLAWYCAKGIHKIMQSYKSFIAPQITNKKIEELQHNIENLTPHYIKLQTIKDRINKQYRSGRIDDAEYDKCFEDIDKEKAILDNEKRKIENQIERIKEQGERINQLQNEQVEYDLMTDEERKELCKSCLDSIIITKTGKYDYEIQVEPTQSLPIGIAMKSYKYSCKGGQKVLKEYLGDKETDITNEIIIRFKNDKRQRYAKNKKGLA